MGSRGSVDRGDIAHCACGITFISDDPKGGYGCGSSA